MQADVFEDVTMIGGKRVLFVMAINAEYGPHLQRLLAPTDHRRGSGGGSGKRVGNAGQPCVKWCAAGPRRVARFCWLRTLEQTKVYQVTSVSYRDMDASALGFKKGATPFLNLPIVVPLGYRIPGVKEASLSTGANIVSGSGL